MSETRKVAYWGPEDCEQLTHEDMDEAIEEMLDGTYPGPLSGKIEVYGYARMEVGVPSGALEDVLENLHMEYGNPDENWEDPTPKMKLAEEMFLEVIRSEYKPYLCEIIETQEIDVAKWVLANRPDWLKDVTIQERRKTG